MTNRVCGVKRPCISMSWRTIRRCLSKLQMFTFFARKFYRNKSILRMHSHMCSSMSLQESSSSQCGLQQQKINLNNSSIGNWVRKSRHIPVLKCCVSSGKHGVCLTTVVKKSSHVIKGEKRNKTLFVGSQVLLPHRTALF